MLTRCEEKQTFFGDCADSTRFGRTHEFVRSPNTGRLLPCSETLMLQDGSNEKMKVHDFVVVPCDNTPSIDKETDAKSD